MYRMLVVDDIPDIVDWIYELILEQIDMDIEVYKAYNGMEALEHLNNTKIDIVMTDIRMPGITGIELMKQIRVNWPLCRVIFLTGYNDFDYVYTAIKEEGVSYLLKTEEDEEILSEVKRAINEIEKDLRNEELIKTSKSYIQAAKPFLQKDFFMNLLHGDSDPSVIAKESFEELGIELNYKLPTLHLIVYIENNGIENLSGLKKAEYLYSIDCIVQKYLSNCIFLNLYIEKNTLLCLIQPKDEFITVNGCETAWRKLEIIIRDNIESIQKSCKEILGLAATFLMDTRVTTWDSIAERIKFTRNILSNSICFGTEMILNDKTYGDGKDIYNSLQSNQNKLKYNSPQLEIITGYLERGQAKEYQELFNSLTEELKNNGNKNSNHAREMYLSFTLMLLSYINKCGIGEKLAVQIPLYKLTRADEYNSWDEAVEYLSELSKLIFQIKKSDNQDKSENIMEDVKRYINDNLSKDLSLNKLAEVVHFNPSYLSRLFKQYTGHKLSEYISEAKIKKAKELLENTNLKISQIAEAIGFDSPRYFAHFFKNAAKMNPLDYREAKVKKSHNM
jgi:two-component system, response regulator YesN